MMTKFDFNISYEVFQKNSKRLINQLWKLIPMRENNEDWKKQLNTVINEIAGLNEIFCSNPLFLEVLSKLEGLCVKDNNFEFYRKTIFESINLIQGLIKNGWL